MFGFASAAFAGLEKAQSAASRRERRIVFTPVNHARTPISDIWLGKNHVRLAAALGLVGNIEEIFFEREPAVLVCVLLFEDRAARRSAKLCFAPVFAAKLRATSRDAARSGMCCTGHPRALRGLARSRGEP